MRIVYIFIRFLFLQLGESTAVFGSYNFYEFMRLSIFLITFGILLYFQIPGHAYFFFNNLHLAVYVNSQLALLILYALYFQRYTE